MTICKLRREASGENNPPELGQSRGWVLVPPAAATKKPGSEMSDILWELLRVSERAANIAWVCRQQEALFQLLIEEKKEAEKEQDLHLISKPWLMYWYRKLPNRIWRTSFQAWGKIFLEKNQINLLMIWGKRLS